MAEHPLVEPLFRYDIPQMLIDDLRSRITTPLLTDRLKEDSQLRAMNAALLREVEGDGGMG